MGQTRTQLLRPRENPPSPLTTQEPLQLNPLQPGHVSLFQPLPVAADPCHNSARTRTSSAPAVSAAAPTSTKPFHRRPRPELTPPTKAPPLSSSPTATPTAAPQSSAKPSPPTTPASSGSNPPQHPRKYPRSSHGLSADANLPLLRLLAHNDGVLSSAPNPSRLTHHLPRPHHHPSHRRPRPHRRTPRPHPHRLPAR